MGNSICTIFFTIMWCYCRNVFNDSNVYLLPILSIIICIVMTYIATVGVKKFSWLSDFGGKFTLAVTVIFILMAFVYVLMGKPSATEFTYESVIPTFNVKYFSTFSWLLFAVSGSEVAGTYIKLSLLGLAIRSVSLRSFNKEHNTDEKIEEFAVIEETALRK